MKTLLLAWLALGYVASIVEAETNTVRFFQAKPPASVSVLGSDRAAIYARVAFTLPYRQWGNDVWDLRPLRAAMASGDIQRAEATMLCGRLLRKLEDGWLMALDRKVHGARASGLDEVVFLYRLPGSDLLVDDSAFAVLARPAGIYSYDTSMGGGRTVRRFDCGEVPTKELVAKFAEMDAQQAAQARDSAAKMQAATKAADDKRLADAKARAEKARAERAAKEKLDGK